MFRVMIRKSTAGMPAKLAAIVGRDFDLGKFPTRERAEAYAKTCKRYGRVWVEEIPDASTDRSSPQVCPKCCADLIRAGKALDGDFCEDCRTPTRRAS